MREVKVYTLVMGEKEILNFKHGEEQRLGQFVKYKDYAALEAKCAALAAENAGMKSGAIDEIEVINRGGQAYCVKDGVQVNPMYARGWNDYRAKSLQSDTTATDAFLSEVRAQGVEMYADNLDNGADDAERGGFDYSVKFLRSEASGVRLFADQIRKGGWQK